MVYSPHIMQRITLLFAANKVIITAEDTEIMTYIYELKGWPNFFWEQESLAGRLGAVHQLQGRLLGRMEALGFTLRKEALLQTLTEEVIKSSEIEGEILDKAQVRSSIARRLGMDIGGLTPTPRNVEGVVEMMIDATQKFDFPLTKERLIGWHAALFPTGYSGTTKITVGKWRDDSNGPMQVVSGIIGREQVHYEAPAASRLEEEMEKFLFWFNKSDGSDLILKAGIAHLWFVTIHPFDDGNGRIARAIADMMLARSENSTQRFYSMSAQIQQDREDYYDLLEATQKGNLNITNWLDWFIGCLGRAFERTETISAEVFKKARFWKHIANIPLNERQRTIINRLLGNFEGKLTTSKWAKMAKCSPDTALRDIENLIEHGMLIKDSAGGRSTSYSLAPYHVQALRALATYTQLHSDKFSRSGSKMLSVEEKEAQRLRIENLANQISKLANEPNKGGQAIYREFEAILSQLHKNNFWPDDDLVLEVTSSLSGYNVQT